MIKKITLIWNTLKFLKPIQIYWRIWIKLYTPKLDTSLLKVTIREASTQLIPPLKKPASLQSSQTFIFLNESHLLESPTDWNHPKWEKLWLYNLHYFDYLNAIDADKKYLVHSALIKKWINENPPNFANGWEPYPLSLRIVNWIKWLERGNKLNLNEMQSLVIQVRCLRQKLEYHLLGNHLFANAKALVFSGLYFKSDEASEWLTKGLEILAQELPEQILDDGAHFELSPMYHCIIFEDLLDIINVVHSYKGMIDTEVMEYWESLAKKMYQWLSLMIHPDGEIALFNDAALGIAAKPHDLFSYANSVLTTMVSSKENPTKRNQLLAESGYARLESRNIVLFADVGKIGPDYLPGHAHADTLSFELSLFGKRIIVDSGTSCYGYSDERLRQRSSASHNTVTVNGQNSSEVWGGFRVAKRAFPSDVKFVQSEHTVQLSASHTGYQRLHKNILHSRKWSLKPNQLTIKDTVTGSFETATGRLLFAPEVEIINTKTDNSYLISIKNKVIATLVINNSDTKVTDSTYHPEFGVTRNTTCIEYSANSNPITIIEIQKNS